MVDFPDSPAPALVLVMRRGVLIRGYRDWLTEQKHLDLIALKHLIPLQLVLDLLIPGLALLLLSAHTTTHLGCLLKTSGTCNWGARRRANDLYLKLVSDQEPAIVEGRKRTETDREIGNDEVEVYERTTELGSIAMRAVVYSVDYRSKFVTAVMRRCVLADARGLDLCCACCEGWAATFARDEEESEKSEANIPVCRCNGSGRQPVLH